MAINESSHIAQSNPILYFSLEMKQESIINRICADFAEIPNYRVQKNDIYSGEMQQYDSAMGNIEKLNLFINDKPRLTINQIYLIAKKMKFQNGIKAIIIDHFHLIKIKGKDKMADYEENARMLKVIAKDLDLPVICLFQLNRDIEKRAGSKKPKMSDLREVGEQDADVIAFVTQPEKLEVEAFADGTPSSNKIVVNIAKNREGIPGSELIFDFKGDYQRVYESEHEYIKQRKDVFE